MTNLEYFSGTPLKLNDKLSIRHPKIKDIIELGHDTYMKYVSTLITTKYDVADILWFENKIWYEDIKSDWDFFIQRALSNKKFAPVTIRQDDKMLDMEMDSIFISDSFTEALNYFLGLDGSYILLRITKGEHKQTVFLSTKKDDDGYYIDKDSIKFTEHYYHVMLDYLKTINWINPDYEFTHGGNKSAKKYILQNDYKKRNKKHSPKVDLQSIISSIIVKGIPYSEVWEYPIYAVYELYYRLLKIDSYSNTTRALYSGHYDTKKHPINWDKLNWTAIIKQT